MQAGMQVPPLGKVNKIIIGATIGLFILSSILEKTSGVSLTSQLGLSFSSFFSGHIYQLFTYPWMSHGLISVIFNSLILWFLGSEFESSWGFRRYLYFIVFSAVGGGIIFLIVGMILFQGGGVVANFPLSGLSGVCSALCLAYAIINPDRMFTFMLLFPMKAKYFCMILIGIELYQGFFSPAAVLSWGHLGTMGAGYGMLLLFSRKSISAPGFLKNIKKQKRVPKNSHLKIVKDDDEDDSPKYFQ